MSLLPAGSLPYFAPYAVFLALVQLEELAPAYAAALLPLRVGATLLLFGWFWRRGAYPELSGYRVDARSALDLAAGLAIAALWVGPYVAFPALERGAPFDPELLGDSRALTLGVRLVGFALLTPFIEELFVRSFLIRFAEVLEGGDFRSVPLARFAPRGFALTVAWFTFSHASWEWWVALPAGVAFNAWLYWRRSVAACVVAHAAANAAIWALVVFGPLPLWEFL
jgi:CAAX prenyl protease-like protein